MVGGLVRGVVEQQGGDDVGSVRALLDHLDHAGRVDVEGARALVRGQQVVVEDQADLEVLPVLLALEQGADHEPPQRQQGDHGLRVLEEGRQPCLVPLLAVQADLADAREWVDVLLALRLRRALLLGLLLDLLLERLPLLRRGGRGRLGGLLGHLLKGLDGGLGLGLRGRGALLALLAEGLPEHGAGDVGGPEGGLDLLVLGQRLDQVLVDLLVLLDLLSRRVVVQDDLGHLEERAGLVDRQLLTQLVEPLGGPAVQAHAGGVERILRVGRTQGRLDVDHDVGGELGRLDELREPLEPHEDAACVVEALVGLGDPLHPLTPVQVLGDLCPLAVEGVGDRLAVVGDVNVRLAAGQQSLQRDVAAPPALLLHVVDGEGDALLEEGGRVLDDVLVEALTQVDRAQRVQLPAEGLAAPEQHGLGQTEAARLVGLLRPLALRPAKHQEGVEDHVAGHAGPVVLPLEGARGRIPAHVEAALARPDLAHLDRVADRVSGVLQRLARRDELQLVVLAVQVLRVQLPQHAHVAAHAAPAQRPALRGATLRPLRRSALRALRGAAAPRPLTRHARCGRQACRAQRPPHTIGVVSLHGDLTRDWTRCRHHTRSSPDGRPRRSIQASATALACRSSGWRSWAASWLG